MWFLEDLLLISLVIASLVCWFSRTGADEGQSITERFAANLSETAAVFLLAVLSMIAMYVAPSPGAIDPWNLSQNMNRDPAVTVFYATFFCYGWFLNRNPGLFRIMERYALRILVVGALLRLGSLVILLTLDRSARVIPMVTVTCCYSWFMVLGSIGLFQRVIRTDRPILRYITDMSYFFYFALSTPSDYDAESPQSRFELPAALKFASAIFVTMGMLLITYEYAVRYTPMGTLLNEKDGELQVRVQPPGRCVRCDLVTRGHPADHPLNRSEAVSRTESCISPDVPSALLSFFIISIEHHRAF